MLASELTTKSSSPLNWASAAARRRVFVAKTLEAVKKHNAGWIVLGWPLDPFGREGPECDLARGFIARLRAAGLTQPILLWDERNSSVVARSRLRQESASRTMNRAGRSGGDDGLGESGITMALRSRQAAARTLAPEQRSKVDEEAALVILQSCQAAYARYQNERQNKPELENMQPRPPS